MQKVVNVCTRVEGHGKVEYFLQNEKIEHVEFDLSVFRGFENLLLGKKLNDIPRIVSRICGLCHASQTFASCKAIENIYEIEPSFQSTLLRRLLMTGELIKSHIMHFFFQCMPDLLEIFQMVKKEINSYQLIKFDPQLTTSVYDLIKLATEINNVFGGRILHLITPTPGGIIYIPSKKNLIIIQKYLQKALSNIQYILNKFIDLFSIKNPPLEFNLTDTTYLGMLNNQKYDRYKGDLNIGQNNRNEINIDIAEYEKYFNKDSNLFGIKFISNDNKNILTGPFARFNLAQIDNNKRDSYLTAFSNSWNNNLLFMNFLQLLEVNDEIKKSIEILENHNLDNKESFPSLSSIVNHNGIGIIEAPRGSLIHHYHLNKSNVVDQVKLFIATEINFPLLNASIKNYAQNLYEKEDLESVNRKVQMMIRAFDPCISCATH